MFTTFVVDAVVLAAGGVDVDEALLAGVEVEVVELAFWTTVEVAGLLTVLGEVEGVDCAAKVRPPAVKAVAVRT